MHCGKFCFVLFCSNLFYAAFLIYVTVAQYNTFKYIAVGNYLLMPAMMLYYYCSNLSQYITGFSLVFGLDCSQAKVT